MCEEFVDQVNGNKRVQPGRPRIVSINSNASSSGNAKGKGVTDQCGLPGRPPCGSELNYDYSPKEIDSVAERVRDLADESAGVHVAFNNNHSLYAPKAAMRLKVAMGFA